MNKLLAALLLLFTCNVNAEAWVSNNNAGGEIVITDSICYINGKTLNSLRQGHARNSGGQMISGCWYYDNQTVHMIYEDGTKYAYPVHLFRKMEVY